MTEKDKTHKPAEGVAKFLAEKGDATLDIMQATVDRARAMLANREVFPPPDGTDLDRKPYAWETTPQCMEGPYRIWFASASDYATGEGVSIYFAAEFAADEGEFRRSIATIPGTGDGKRSTSK